VAGTDFAHIDRYASRGAHYVGQNNNQNARVFSSEQFRNQEHHIKYIIYASGTYIIKWLQYFYFNIRTNTSIIERILT
jgi:hypothetical protein